MEFVGWLWRVRAPLEYKVNRIYWSHRESISTLSLAASQDAEGSEHKILLFGQCMFWQGRSGNRNWRFFSGDCSLPPDCEQWVEGYAAKIWLSALFLYIPHSFVALMSFWQAHFPTHWLEQHIWDVGLQIQSKLAQFVIWAPHSSIVQNRYIHPFHSSMKIIALKTPPAAALYVEIC